MDNHRQTDQNGTPHSPKNALRLDRAPLLLPVPRSHRQSAHRTVEVLELGAGAGAVVATEGVEEPMAVAVAAPPKPPRGSGGCEEVQSECEEAFGFANKKGI